MSKMRIGETVRAQILFEVASWAAHKRDDKIVVPTMLRHDERQTWAEGYRWAMNEVAQHYNMERIRAEREEQS